MGILSGRGAYEGSKRESSGYKDAIRILATLKPEAEKTRDYIDPWGEYREDYAGKLNRILTGQEDFTTDPGYQFRVEEDARATERAASTRGLNISGNVLAELGNRRQQIASQEYNNIINRLTGLAAATPQQAQVAGQTYGNMISTAITGMAQARVGQGFSEGRGIAAGHTGIEDTFYSLMNYFIPGSNGAWGGNDRVGGGTGGMPTNLTGGAGGGSLSSMGGADLTIGNSMSGNTGATAAGFNVGSGFSALGGSGGGSGFSGASSSMGSLF